jgi:hypothetical protein
MQHRSPVAVSQPQPIERNDSMTAPLLASRVTARLALALPLLLAACAGSEEPPRSFPPLTYDYLTKLKLNVARLNIDDSWTPPAGSNQIGNMSPVQPLDTLRKMAQDRLVPGGSSGRAVFVIDNASIVETPTNYQGSFAVHLDITTSDGTRSGYAEARVTRTRGRSEDESPDAGRAELYDLVHQMMNDMNVEFEYQVRRSLRDYLQTTTPIVPQPGPVQTQDLSPPGPAK